MTGRDLIVYILQNDLEDAPVFENGKFIGTMTDIEAAVKLNTGVSTIHSLIHIGKLDGFSVGDKRYIYASDVTNRKE